jgi:hypothetical protein
MSRALSGSRSFTPAESAAPAQVERALADIA